MGMIQSVDGNTYWKYNYDDDGNFIEVVNSLGKISFEIEAGERISGVKGRDLKVTYGLSGEVKHRDGHSYLYNCRKQLIKIFHGDNVWKEGPQPQKPEKPRATVPKFRMADHLEKN